MRSSLQSTRRRVGATQAIAQQSIPHTGGIALKRSPWAAWEKPEIFFGRPSRVPVLNQARIPDPGVALMMSALRRSMTYGPGRARRSLPGV
jgi:hypothetical protein